MLFAVFVCVLVMLCMLIFTSERFSTSIFNLHPTFQNMVVRLFVFFFCNVSSALITISNDIILSSDDIFPLTPSPLLIVYVGTAKPVSFFYSAWTRLRRRLAKTNERRDRKKGKEIFIQIKREPRHKETGHTRSMPSLGTCFILSGDGECFCCCCCCCCISLRSSIRYHFCYRPTPPV